MGTFHHNTHELHGITVLIDLADGSSVIGRFHEQDAAHVLLLDADTHRDNEGGKSNAEWLNAAVNWGQWPRIKQLRLATSDIKSMRKLGDVAV